MTIKKDNKTQAEIILIYLETMIGSA